MDSRVTPSVHPRNAYNSHRRKSSGPGKKHSFVKKYALFGWTTKSGATSVCDRTSNSEYRRVGRGTVPPIRQGELPCLRCIWEVTSEELFPGPHVSPATGHSRLYVWRLWSHDDLPPDGYHPQPGTAGRQESELHRPEHRRHSGLWNSRRDGRQSDLGTTGRQDRRATYVSDRDCADGSVGGRLRALAERDGVHRLFGAALLHQVVGLAGR